MSVYGIVLVSICEIFAFPPHAIGKRGNYAVHTWEYFFLFPSFILYNFHFIFWYMYVTLDIIIMINTEKHYPGAHVTPPPHPEDICSSSER